VTRLFVRFLALALAALSVQAVAPASAQPPADAVLADEVTAREPRECTPPQQPPYQGRSLWSADLWPGGIVYYEFDANATSENRAAMRQAMDTLEQSAGVHFVAGTGQGSYLHIKNSTVNSSYVGMIGVGQTVNIYNWNYGFIMCHELMHALGLWHEQSRPDRGQFITVNYANIRNTCGSDGISSCAYNFDIRAAAMQGEYDFDSVMHYGPYAFSSNDQPTIVCLPPNEAWQPLIGQRTHLSVGDQQGLVSRYGPSTVPPPPPASWTQRVVSGPSARAGHAMAYDAQRGVTVLFGGNIYPAQYNSETWEWNGSTWTQRVVSGPSPRYGHAMAYDAARGVTVLFGGGPSENGDTWEWDGIAWTRRMVNGPSPRQSSAMAYDAARGVTVLFGGYFSEGPTGLNFADTWEWNGISWTQRSASGPSPRFAHAMAYDSPRAVIVLFGGTADSGGANNQTWEWNGTAWTQRSVSGPSQRSRHTMAYDPARAETILFGGLSLNAPSGETWIWNATAWAQRTGGPPPRYDHAMAYDAARAQTVLFGGATSTTTRSGETWLLTAPCVPTSVNAQPIPQAVCQGNTASFSTSPFGTGPFTYLWRRGGTPLADEPNHIVGATAGTLGIVNTIATDQGDYDCIVTNPCGTATSSAAALTVLVCTCSADFNGDGDTGTDLDIEAFFACLGGNCCPACGSADFNGDGDTGTDLDIEAFFRVLGGGSC